MTRKIRQAKAVASKAVKESVFKDIKESLEQAPSIFRNTDVVIKHSPIILRNRIKCNLCKEIIESTHRHDFKYCSCKTVAVDGGYDYLRRLGTDYTELSRTVSAYDTLDIDTTKTLLEDYIEWVEQYKNVFGDNADSTIALKSRFYDRWIERIKWLIQSLEDAKMKD